MCFNCVAKVRSAFRTVSPACSDGIVLFGGCERMLTISDAACTKKSVRLNEGKSRSCGKNSTVSHALVSFVRGK